MIHTAIEYVQAIRDGRVDVGLLPWPALDGVLAAWGDGVLRVRVPYTPGRKDRQIASELLQALGEQPLTPNRPTVQVWSEISSLLQERDYSLVVVENGDLLDRYAFEYLHRKYLPAVILVGGDRLRKKINQAGDYARRVSPWTRMELSPAD